MNSLTYSRIDHGVRDESPIRLKHDLWTVKGAGQCDMHYDVELGVVLKGSMVRRCGGWQGEVRDGDFWLHGVWEPHSAEVVDAPLELIMFHVQPDILARHVFPEASEVNWLNLFALPVSMRPVCAAGDGGIWKDFGVRMRALSRLPDTWCTRIRMRCCLYEFLTQIISRHCEGSFLRRAQSRWSEGLARAVDLALNSCCRVPVSKAAEAAGMDRNSFSRQFVELVGLSFTDFQLHRRLRSAAAELLESDIPIKEAAEKWGFVDKSHFHNHFVKLFACTPGQWRMNRGRTGSAEAAQI